LPYLKAMLSRGFVARYYLEDIRWLHIQSRSYSAYPMVCFCDIPLSRIMSHTDFYGGYGLGMTKEWALKNHLSPMLYSGDNSPLLNVVNDLFEQHAKSLSGKSKSKRLARELLLVETLAFAKPISGRMRRGTTEIEKDFYQENEWRYVPKLMNDRLVLEDRFFDEQEKLNGCAALYPLAFSAADVRYIIVKQERNLVSIHDFIMSKLTDRSTDERAKLATRLISLEALRGDV